MDREGRSPENLCEIVARGTLDHGVTNIRTFIDQENPTRVAVLMDVADMDAVMAAMQTPALADPMEYDGVLPETLVILTEA